MRHDALGSRATAAFPCGSNYDSRVIVQSRAGADPCGLHRPLAFPLLLALFSIRCPARAAEAPLSGKVVGVTDGDTITVLVDRQARRVRLAEIDIPERGQPCGNRAKQALSDKVFGQVVELQVVDTDRYCRTVAS